MNKLVAVLGTTTVGFAALTAYYAYELAQENKRTVPETAVVAAVAPPAPQLAESGPRDSRVVQAMPAPAKLPATAAPVLAKSVATAKPAAAKPVTNLSAADAEFLAMYVDARGRRTLIDEAIVDQRKLMQGAQRQVGFTDEEWQRVLEVKAEQQVERRAALLRCRADPNCKSPFTPEYLANERQAVRDAVGEEKYAEYDQYMNTMIERRAVAELQKNLLGDLALPDQRAEELIAALADERVQAVKDMSVDGNRVAGMGVPNGFAYYVESAPTLEARIQTANQYSQRMRDRAATILNGNQLTTFNQMQDQMLASLRAFLARKEAEPPKPQKMARTEL